MQGEEIERHDYLVVAVTHLRGRAIPGEVLGLLEKGRMHPRLTRRSTKPGGDFSEGAPRWKGYPRLSGHASDSCATTSWRPVADLPSAVACLDDDFEACIAHLRFPLVHRRAMRTTNLLERLFGEERHRTKVIPHALASAPSSS
jgi:Transposase, Mutator family